MMNKLWQLIMVVIVIAFLLNLLMSAIGPFLHLIGATISIALICGLFGGLGFIGYRLYQRYMGERHYDGM